MFLFLKSLFAGHSQFASDGLLLMVFGGLGVYLRAIPKKLWDWSVGQLTLTVSVKDDDRAFVWVKEWFLDQPFLHTLRSVDLDTSLRSQKFALVPAPGRHWFWYRGRPFRVSFFRSQE